MLDCFLLGIHLDQRETAHDFFRLGEWPVGHAGIFRLTTARGHPSRWASILRLRAELQTSSCPRSTCPSAPFPAGLGEYLPSCWACTSIKIARCFSSQYLFAAGLLGSDLLEASLYCHDERERLCSTTSRQLLCAGEWRTQPRTPSVTFSKSGRARGLPVP